MSEIDALTLNGWADGKAPIDIAINALAILVDVRDTIAVGRSRDPDSFPLPGWSSTCPQTVAGKIVAALLDAGWTPPSNMVVAEELRRAAERMERTTDDEILAVHGPDPAPDYLERVRADIARRVALYRQRAAELDGEATDQPGGVS